MGESLTNPELNVHCTTEELIKSAQAFNLEIEDLAIRYAGSNLAVLEKEGLLPGPLSSLIASRNNIATQINYLQSLP